MTAPSSPSHDSKNNANCCGFYVNDNHVLALQILAQSLRIFNSASLTRTRTTCSENRFFWGPILTALFRNIQNAASRPLEACLSIQCFDQLSDITRVLAPVDIGSLNQHLRSAHQFGIRHNASLEKETRQLLCRLQTTVKVQ